MLRPQHKHRLTGQLLVALIGGIEHFFLHRHMDLERRNKLLEEFTGFDPGFLFNGIGKVVQKTLEL